MPTTNLTRRLLVLLTLVALVLAGCSAAGDTTTTTGQASQGTEPSDDTTPPDSGEPSEPVTMTVAYSTDPGGFEGLATYSSWSSQIMIQMFNRLLAYDSGYNVVGDLAESWSVSDDGTVWEFNLRDDVQWHDGEPFTSADVAFKYELLAELAATPAAVALENLTAIETPDDYTVIFSFSVPTQVEVFLDHQADTFILPRHIYEGTDWETNPANTAPVGTGPFTFVSYDPGESVVLEANDDYFDGRPQIDRLIYRFVQDQAAALVALRAGEVDVIEMDLGVSTTEVPNLEADPDFEVDPFPYTTTAWLAFNASQAGIDANPWLADIDVRRAIMMAIDRDFIVERVLSGVTTKVDTMISDTVTWAHNDAVTMPPYDPEAAEQLLDEAGWPRDGNGIRFSMDLPAPIFGGMDASAEAIAEMLRQVGIQVDVTAVEVTSYIEQYLRNENGIGDAAATVISGGTGPNPVVTRVWYDSNRTPGGNPPGNNFTFYSNPEVDELIAQVEVTVDQGSAAPIYKEMQELVAADLWHLNLFNRFQIETWSARFTGFRETHRPLAWFASYAKITLAE